MTAHRHHAKMKNSGVAWLGKVPAHWDVRRLGHFFFERREKVSDKDFSPLSVTKSGIVPQLATAAKTDDGDNRKRVCIGDFVINSRSDRKGSSGVSPLDGSVSLINTVLQPSGGLSVGYVNHLLRSYPFQEEFYRVGSGIVADMWTTKYSEMKNILLPVPDEKEQQAIADHLDHETGRIENLIVRKTRFIELLAEKRQALITHAVTKGLNPKAKMKDSGVEWLGQVPERWSVGPLCYLSSINTGATPNREVADYWNGEIPWLKTAEVNWTPIREAEEFVTEKALAETAIRISPPGTMLMAMYGQGVTRGRVALLEIEATYNQACAAITFGSRIIPEFAIYFFMAAYKYIRDFGNETSQMNLNAELVSKFKMTIPPRGEQAEIINYLNDASGKYDTLIAKTKQSIELLREHRTALITAAVTGKIDLRDNA